MKKWIAISVALVALALVYVFGVNGSKWDELTVTLEVLEPATVKFNFTCEENGEYNPKTGIYPTPEVDSPTKLEINWGDGQVTDSDSHAYQVAGTYIVNIRGKGIGTLNIDRLPYVKISKLSVKSWPNLVYLATVPDHIDFTQCPGLEAVHCCFTHPIALDFSKCPKLEYLTVWRFVTDLNVTGCTKLKQLDCSDCLLTKLDVSTCPELVVLHCYDNKIKTLDLSENIALQQLQCNNNQITDLNISGCPSLRMIVCSNNQLNHSAQNRIYNALPYWKGGWIFINNNPATGDTSLIIKKGWEIKHLE